MSIPFSRKFDVLGVGISCVSKEQFLDFIRSSLRDSHVPPLSVATVNPEFVMGAVADESFRSLLNSFSFAVADGVGIVLALRVLHRCSLERITGSDLAIDLVCMAGEEKKKVFLLGSEEGVAQRARCNLLRMGYACEMYAFSGSPYLDVDKFPSFTRNEIENSHIILVAYGAPLQEQWIKRNLPHLPCCRVIVGVGGTLDFISGNVQRAPLWMRRVGLEWFFRLLRQPWRYKRMSLLPFFVLLVVKEAIIRLCRRVLSSFFLR